MDQTPVPEPLQRGVQLMRVGALLSVLSTVYPLTRTDELRRVVTENAVKNNPDVSSSTIDKGVGFAIGFIIFFGLVSVALWLWMASANLRGRTWARVTATVLGVLNILVLGFGLGASDQTAISLGIAAATLLVSLASLVLIHRPASTKYYVEQTYGR